MKINSGFIFLIIAYCFVSISCQHRKGTQQEKNLSGMNDSSQNSRGQNLRLVLEVKGIKDKKVLSAIEKIPRERFIDPNLADRAYEDRALPINKGQTISQPYTVAFQTELLRLNSDEKVLEIGTGSGYQAAILCEIGVEVYSIERHHELHLKAQELLDSLGYYPKLFYGDGYEGLPQYAPFDKILLTAATDVFPEKLLVYIFKLMFTISA